VPPGNSTCPRSTTSSPSSSDSICRTATQHRLLCQLASDRFQPQTRNIYSPSTCHSLKLLVPSSSHQPSLVPNWLKPLAFSLVLSANGTSPTGRWQSTSYDTFATQPISASCLMGSAASKSFSATLTPTGEATWTLDVVGECPTAYIDLWLSPVSTLAFHFYVVKMVLVYIAAPLH
jgi:hypothetical protein